MWEYNGGWEWKQSTWVSLGNKAKGRFWVSGHGLGSERGKTEWENEKGRELCHLRGNRVFVCLKFLQSSKCWVLYFVFIYFLLEFQPDSKPVSTWFDQYGPIQPELARICKQKKGHATDTHEMASTITLLVCACRVRV